MTPPDDQFINCGNYCVVEEPYGLEPEAECPIHDRRFPKRYVSSFPWWIWMGLGALVVILFVIGSIIHSTFNM